MHAGLERRAHWRDNIEAVAMAIVMALLLKYFIVEAYKIPTGSMQPTLIGDEEAGIQDRILVDKLSYVLHEPQRWDVAVFRYPLDRSKNFVKRIAGVGPEEFRILYGDLWHRPDGLTPWTVIRRPRGVQDTIWKRLDVDQPDRTSWGSLSPGADWRIEGRSIRARGTGEAAFRADRGSIVDSYQDGYPESLRQLLPSQHASSGSNVVGDLRLDAEVRGLPGLLSMTVELGEGDRRYRFRVPGAAAPEDAKVEILVRSLGTFDQPYLGVAVGDAPYRLPAGEAVRLRVQNLDDLLELELEGEIVATLEVEAARNQSSSVHLKLEGEGADLENIMVYRDIYYLSSGTSEVTIPEGHYFMLGDNTQDSSDSREWTLVRFAEPNGDAEPLIHRGNLRRGENPRVLGYGEPDGPWTYLRNEWGEQNWFRDGQVERIASEDSPFVPRDMIQGKALAVFWPHDPFAGVHRMQWVR